MKRPQPHATAWRGLAALLVSSAVSGCAYHGDGPVEVHYERYKARLPEGNRVFVCSAYGCRTQTPFRFETADIAQLQTMLSPAKTKTPADERKAVQAALAWMEQRADKAVGTDQDRPGDDMAGNGDPGQMD